MKSWIFSVMTLFSLFCEAEEKGSPQHELVSNAGEIVLIELASVDSKNGALIDKSYLSFETATKDTVDLSWYLDCKQSPVHKDDKESLRYSRIKLSIVKKSADKKIATDGMDVVITGGSSSTFVGKDKIVESLPVGPDLEHSKKLEWKKEGDGESAVIAKNELRTYGVKIIKFKDRASYLKYLEKYDKEDAEMIQKDHLKI